MVQKDSLKTKIIIITGPTAIGKSALSVKVAQQFNGEIISVDSMQIYKRLNIGTGKITEESMNGIKHFLIDIKEPDEEYSVSEFVVDAKNAINKVISKGKLPILTGGTGLYINALLNGYNFANAPKSNEIRNELSFELIKNGNVYLHEKLKSIDKSAADKISPNDTKRVIRALEIFALKGNAKSDIISEDLNTAYDYLMFVLDEERNILYNRINDRVDQMMEQGLLNEVESLYEFKDCQSMQAIGYKELVAYLNGIGNLTQAVNLIKQNTRHYAKRQLTYFRWLKSEKFWIPKEKQYDILDKISDFK